MHPLALVWMILGLFLVSAFTLTGLILADWLGERRRNPRQQDHLQLNLESLIEQLTATA